MPIIEGIRSPNPSGFQLGDRLPIRIAARCLTDCCAPSNGVEVASPPAGFGFSHQQTELRQTYSPQRPSSLLTSSREFHQKPFSRKNQAIRRPSKATAGRVSQRQRRRVSGCIRAASPRTSLHSKGGGDPAAIENWSPRLISRRLHQFDRHYERGSLVRQGTSHAHPARDPGKDLAVQDIISCGCFFCCGWTHYESDVVESDDLRPSASELFYTRPLLQAHLP